MATIEWGGLWKVRITPIGESSDTFQSSDGVLSWIEILDQTDGAPYFRFALMNENGVYNSKYEIGDTVDIWLDPNSGTLGTTKRLVGFVKRVGYLRNNVKNEVIIQGFGYIDLFLRTIVHEVYSGERTYESIITDPSDGLLVKYAPGISGLGVNATGRNLDENETIVFNHEYLYDVLARLRDLVGDWTFYLTPNQTLQFQPRGYIDTSKEITEFDDVLFEYEDDQLMVRIYGFGGQDTRPLDTTLWVGTASNNSADAPKTYNRELSTGWDSGVAQAPGQWYLLDLGTVISVEKMFIVNSSFGQSNYARAFQVEASINGQDWSVIYTTTGNTKNTTIVSFPNGICKYIKITLTGSDSSTWSLGEIYLYDNYRLLTKVEDSAGLLEYGTYESVIRDSSLLQKEQLRNRCLSDLAKYKTPVLSGKIELTHLVDVSPNELVFINIPATPVTQKLVVEKVSYYEDTFGSFRETIYMRSI